MNFSIHPFVPEDFPQVQEIYRQGIATRNATFQTQVKSWEEWDLGFLQHSRLVAKSGGQVLAWAALSGVSDRCCYAGVAEVTVYVAEQAQGHGVGRRILSELIQSSEAEGYWTLQAGIFKRNEASIKLHQACGFELLGVRKKLGKLHDEWIDVVLMERRSTTVGQD